MRNRILIVLTVLALVIVGAIGVSQQPTEQLKSAGALVSAFFLVGVYRFFRTRRSREAASTSA